MSAVGVSIRLMGSAEPIRPDEMQQGALEHGAGALLVTGAAGTGKSAVLRERFVRLIESNADMERTVLVLGSRRSRDETRSAILHRLPGSLPSLRVTTIHGLAYDVLSRRFRDLGYEEPPRVLSPPEHLARVRELLLDEDPAEWPAYGSMLRLRGFAEEIRQLLLRAQEALLPPHEMAEAAEARGLSGWLEVAAFF